MLNNEIFSELQSSARLAHFTFPSLDTDSFMGRLLAFSDDLLWLRGFNTQMGGYDGYAVFAREQCTEVIWGSKALRTWERQISIMQQREKRLGLSLTPPVQPWNPRLQDWNALLASLPPQQLITLYTDSDDSPFVMRIHNIFSESLLGELVNQSGQFDGLVAIDIDELVRIDLEGFNEQRLASASGIGLDWETANNALPTLTKKQSAPKASKAKPKRASGSDTPAPAKAKKSSTGAPNSKAAKATSDDPTNSNAKDSPAGNDSKKAITGTTSEDEQADSAAN